jgi:hypothetical protein
MGFKSLNGWRGTPMYCWRYERRTNRNELVSLSRPDCRFVARGLAFPIFVKLGLTILGSFKL